MSKPAYEHFEFSIGQLVAVRACDGHLGYGSKMNIVERSYQECPGGIQLHYICRPVRDGDFSMKLSQFNEVELRAWDAESHAKQKSWQSIIEEMTEAKSA